MGRALFLCLLCFNALLYFLRAFYADHLGQSRAGLVDVLLEAVELSITAVVPPSQYRE